MTLPLKTRVNPFIVSWCVTPTSAVRRPIGDRLRSRVRPLGGRKGVARSGVRTVAGGDCASRGSRARSRSASDDRRRGSDANKHLPRCDSSLAFLARHPVSARSRRAEVGRLNSAGLDEELAYWQTLAMERGRALKVLHQRLRVAVSLVRDEDLLVVSDAIAGRLRGWLHEPDRMPTGTSLRTSDVLTLLDELWQRVEADGGA